MQSGIVEKTRENIKLGYQSKFGQLYIHGITVGGVEYEYHSKSNTLKQRPNETIWYTTSTDKQGNVKIKPEKAPDNTTQQTPNSPGTGTSTPTPYASGPNIRLEIFKALCTLKSGSTAPLKDSVPAILEEVNKLEDTLR